MIRSGAQKVTLINFPSVIKLWNSLPPPVVDSLTLNHFCINLDTYMHNTCTL